MTCGIALNNGSIVCSCVSTQKGTILKAIVVDFLNLLKRKSYRHSLSLFFFFFCVGPCKINSVIPKGSGKITATAKKICFLLYNVYNCGTE